MKRGVKSAWTYISQHKTKFVLTLTKNDLTLVEIYKTQVEILQVNTQVLENVRCPTVMYFMLCDAQWNLSTTETLGPAVLVTYRGFPLSEVKSVSVIPFGDQNFCRGFTIKSRVCEEKFHCICLKLQTDGSLKLKSLLINNWADFFR